MVELDEAACWRLLGQARSAVLGTVHPERGVDAVPVVFAVIAGTVVIPIDAVKSKRHRYLQRILNIERDPRCVVLADHYEDDWVWLWWVRVHGTAEMVAARDLRESVAILAARYAAYRDQEAIVGALRVRPERIVGWAATDATEDGPRDRLRARPPKYIGTLMRRPILP